MSFMQVYSRSLVSIGRGTAEKLTEATMSMHGDMIVCMVFV